VEFRVILIGLQKCKHWRKWVWSRRKIVWKGNPFPSHNVSPQFFVVRQCPAGPTAIPVDSSKAPHMSLDRPPSTSCSIFQHLRRDAPTQFWCCINDSTC